MGLAQKHPTDKGKFQSSVDTYGHGKGNGKSRSMVYKHHKSLNEKKQDSLKSEKVPKNDLNSTGSQSSDFDYTKSDKTEDYTKSDKNEDKWGDVEWLEMDDSDMPKPTIPSHIRKLSSGESGGLSAAQMQTQKQLIKWSFMGVDRGLTHWGRGVTQNPKWEIVRHPSDYDAMEGATSVLLESYDISMKLNPELVWATVMTAAYVPPVMDIAKNSEPARRQRFWNKLTKPSTWFKRKKPTPKPLIYMEALDDPDSN